MSIVNCKVKFIRPKYNNLKEWMEDKNNVYIGRKGIVFIDKERYPKKSSIFSNPYKVGKDGTRKEVVEKYRKYIKKRVEDPLINKELNKLKGKNLGCWCYPELCHGNILLDIINSKNY
jgi:hypothetical protein